MSITIIVPAYNKQECICEVIDKLQEIDLNTKKEIIVVDDGSTDNTSDILKKYQDTITVLKHTENRGYGAALKTGIKQATYDLLVITDSDGTYPNEEIKRLLEDMIECDMVVGARTGENVNIPIIRRPAKWFLNKLANYLSNSIIPDLNSGLRVMRKSVVNKFMHILPDGFSFTTTITLAMLTNGNTVRYVPISYHKRKGKSKIRPIHDTLNFFLIIIRTVLYFDPLKVFVPASLFFFIISFIIMLYRIWVKQAFGVTTILLFVCGIQLLAIGMIADLIDKRMK